MLKVRTLFSGIGSPERALKDLQIPYELVDFCEVDKYAVKVTVQFMEFQRKRI